MAFAVAATVASVNSSQAALVIYEPFDDSNVPLPGNVTGEGLAGTWTATANRFTVQSGSMVWGTLPTSGNRVTYVPSGNATASAALGSALGDAGLLDDGATLWFSMIVQMPGDSGSNPETGFAIGTDALGNDNNFQMPVNGQGIGWGIKNNTLRATTWNRTPDRTATGPSAGVNITRLIVGELIWGANAGAADRLNLYLPDTDLNLGSVRSTKTAILNQSAFDRISFSLKSNTNAGFGFDEVRFGSSFDDVIGVVAAAPVPEPATATLGLLAVGGLMMRRRRA